MWILGKKREPERAEERRWKQEMREKRKWEEGRGQRMSKLLGPRGTRVVSYHCLQGDNDKHGGGRRGTSERSHRDLAGRWGRGGRAALGSYGQSGGANSTRETWGALGGETGRSHLTSTVTWDTVWAEGCGERRSRICSRQRERGSLKVLAQKT